jgi:hypothetical protein
MRYSCFLTGDDSDIDIPYVMEVAEDFDDGCIYDTSEVAKLLSMAYENGYKKGKQEGHDILMNVHALMLMPAGGTA